MRAILVEDACGAQFQLHEFRDRRGVFDFVRKARRYQLDTGEQAELVDDNTFAPRRKNVCERLFWY